MQGKGIVKFFLVVLALVCLYQFFMFYPTSKVERKARAYAKSYCLNKEDCKIKTQYSKYLDSVSNETIFSIPLIKKFNYQDLKKNQLAFGLDLKGGMSVVLQVNLKDFILALSGDSNDPSFKRALDAAEARLTSAQDDYVSLFASEWSKVANGKKLNQIFNRNEGLRDRINFSTPDGEVVRIVREKANETVDLTFKRLKERIDGLGVSQPNVSLDASRDLILVELPGIDNPKRARDILQAVAKLEFYDVYRIDDAGILDGFLAADKLLKSGSDTLIEEKTVTYDTIVDYSYDTLGQVVDSTFEVIERDEVDDPFANAGPLLTRLTLNGATGGQLIGGYAELGQVERNQRETVMKLLDDPKVRGQFPRDIAFRYAQKASEDVESGDQTNLYYLYGIKIPRTNKAPLEGDHIVMARSSQDPTSNKVVVTLNMDNVGTKIWAKMTELAAADRNREIAILLDDKVVSCPGVNEPIPSGNSQISGNFTVEEANDLASMLEVGKLPAKTQIIQESIVGPSLGQENINRSLKSLLFGFGLVFLFMVFYYGTGGVVSILALFLNMFFILGALSSVGVVLTLPGIAGIVLTIGMAVDANVIIYERIREELREGKNVISAIQDGFQHSYSAIIDANVTTILTAGVLAYFGLGPIKGFAIVLIIGVLCSLFTAVLITRLMIDWWTNSGKSMSFWTSWSKNAFANLKIDWLGKRKIAYIISGTFIVIGLLSMFGFRGFELGVDFKGGYSYNVEFVDGSNVDAEQIRTSLTNSFGSTPVVKAVDTDNTYNITTSYLINDTREEAHEEVMAKLHEGINAIAGGNVSLESFAEPDGNGVHVTSSSKIGPTIADDIKSSSVYAAIFALILIFLYIFIRFNKWQYSLGAVAALFHDVLIVLGIFSLGHGIFPFSLEIDQAFIAAILTVIGYSINDTVVVFDRIREFMGLYSKNTKTEIVNMAINSTVSRTIITSLTTFFVIAVLFFFGGSSIKGFAFALLAGVVVGTYSSVFVATPIMADLTGELKPKKTKRSGFSRRTAKASS